MSRHLHPAGHGWTSAAVGAGVVVALTFGGSSMAAGEGSAPAERAATSTPSDDADVIDLAERRLERRADRHEHVQDLRRRGAEHLATEGRRGEAVRAGVDAVAALFDVSPEALLAELRDGARLLDLATARGVDTDTLVEAMLTGVREHLDHHVAAGDLTRTQADRLLAGVTERTRQRVERRAEAVERPRAGERWRG